MNTLTNNKRQPRLPHLHNQLLLTDGGLETTLVFHEGWDLPEFAAFPLLDSSSGRNALRRYYERYIAISLRRQCGFVLESPTWRASRRWGELTGYGVKEIEAVNFRAIGMLKALRDEYATSGCPMPISGCIGPQDDGYHPEVRLTAEQAEAYHSQQVSVFAEAGADMVTAITMTYVDEAIGIVRAAARQDLPVVISFTVETDGRLPVGTPLAEAIETVDAATQGGPIYYMVNCAHTEHFVCALKAGGDWRERIGGLRTNASRMSHEELDGCEMLDDGDPIEFGVLHQEMLDLLPNLHVLGGCCGTDHRHVEALADRCLHAKLVG